MKERPILFSAPMVRALLTGTKTQTRRVVKGEVEDVRPPDWYDSRRLVHKATCQRGYCENVEEGELACGGYDLEANGVGSRSPYGAPGDRLWVRETWAPFRDPGEDDPGVSREELRCVDGRWVGYFADLGHIDWDDGDGFTAYRKDGQQRSCWKPSIFMSRWASRIDLEVAGVRVERLQDITAGDAEAEGIANTPNVPRDTMAWALWHVESYRELWESINGAGSWAKNPWVWVIEFKRVRP